MHYLEMEAHEKTDKKSTMSWISLYCSEFASDAAPLTVNSYTQDKMYMQPKQIRDIRQAMGYKVARHVKPR